MLISTSIIGTAIYFLLPLIYEPVPLLHCLLFGALISPTDPIAVLSILRKAGVAEPIETQITGESLFNDGVGVVIFLTLFTVARQGIDEVTAGAITWLLVEEIGGGLLLGWLLGYAGFLMMRRINHYQTEVLISIAIVAAGSVLAPHFHFSGALAILAILIALIARIVSLLIPYLVFRFTYTVPRTSFLLMTWGGLRGGISIALALSFTAQMHRDLFVTVTYTIVLFSILVQGLTLERIVRRLQT